MKTTILTFFFCLFLVEVYGQTNVTEIAFRNADGGDDSDPYRMRKVQGSSNNNWLELQINDDSDESFRIYGNSCVGYGCNTYSGNLYHLFDASGNAFHAGKVGIGISSPITPLHLSSGTPSGVQGLNASTKFTIDAAAGGFMEFRNSADNNTYGGLLFSDNNLGAYMAFKNYPDDRLHIGSYGGIAFEVGTDNNVGGKTERMKIDASGKIGIGTSNPDQLLTVNGTIHGKEVKVDLSVPGPDYVFEKSYDLPSLDEVKSYIDENKHLPEVPSAKEMEKNGVNLGEMNLLLLKKVEEITLYLLDLQEQNKQLRIAQEEVKILKAELNEIKRNLK